MQGYMQFLQVYAHEYLAKHIRQSFDGVLCLKETMFTCLLEFVVCVLFFLSDLRKQLLYNKRSSFCK